MKIAIIGIGGIGGYIGSKLCSAYSVGSEHEIIFIQRGEHYRKIKDLGLIYIGKDEIIIHPNKIYDSTENAGLFDLVFVNVKSRDLEETALSLKGNLHSKSIIITTLNGVNNASRLQVVLPETIILNGCIYVSSAIESPGIVRQIGGAGNLIFGPEKGEISPYAFIEKLLNDAGLKAILSSDIIKAVWEKYMLISSWASLSSKYALPIGAILADEVKRSELKLLLNEVFAVAKANNVGLSDDIIQKCLDRYAQLPYENKTSMQLDIEAGKKPEIDVLTKFIVESGKQLGIEVPGYCSVLQALDNL
jgi:2-dehydropantoate 2-reductase